jgi:hypothetical protein
MLIFRAKKVEIKVDVARHSFRNGGSHPYLT